MMTCLHLWQYLADFYLEWEMFRINVVEETKTHILCSVTFFRKSCRLWDNAAKFGGTRGATNDVKTWRIRAALWTCNATCTHKHAHAYALGHRHGNTRALSLSLSHTHTHTHTHTEICNYCFPTFSTVTRTRLSVCWLSCSASPILCT
jgi:hypothetical protein